MKIAPLAKQAAVLLFLAAASGAAVYALHPLAPALYLEDVPLGQGETTMALVDEQWGADVFWVDARPREQYEEGHLPGAFLLNEQEWDTQLFEHYETIVENDRPVVIYCGSEACQSSHKIAQKLREQVGMTDVYVLRGGWKEAQKLLH